MVFQFGIEDAVWKTADEGLSGLRENYRISLWVTRYDREDRLNCAKQFGSESSLDFFVPEHRFAELLEGLWPKPNLYRHGL